MIKFLPMFVALTCGLGLIACKKDLTPEQIQTAIEARWAAFADAWEAKDAAACASFYQEEGQNIFGENRPTTGRVAITEFYQELFAENQSSEYQHAIDSIKLEGEQVLEMGQFRVDWVRNDSSTWAFEANTTTTWKKNETNTWEIVTFIFVPKEQE